MSTDTERTQVTIDLSLAKIEVRLSELERRLDKTKIDKFFELATRFALPFIIALGSVAPTLHNRVSYLENTAFSRYDYQREMNDLKVQIEKLKDTDPFTRDAFTKVDVKLDALRDSIDKLKERVIRVEAAAIPK
jgi:hypothetical protein